MTDFPILVGKPEPGEPIRLLKDSPTVSDVHVDAPMGAVPALVKRKRKKKHETISADDLAVRMVKADDEQRIVWGVVLEPDSEDSQGDVISKEDVQIAAHRFLYQGGVIGDQHRKAAPETVRPVESFVAPCDFEINGQVVKAGSWVMAAHVPDDDLWQQVKDGRKAAWSIGGTGKRTKL